VRGVDKALDNYDPTSAGRLLECFVDYLSNWYVRRSRRRFWKSENDTDKLAAYSTLYECLIKLVKLMAPFTPFISEAIYQNLVYSVNQEDLDSVHLTDFPVPDESVIDEQLMADTQLVMKVSSLGRAARSSAAIKVRQPLAEVLVGLTSRKECLGLERLKQQVLEELNVKELRVVENIAELERPDYTQARDGDYAVAVDTKVTPELEFEGMAREIVHRLQTMRRQASFEIADYIVTFYEGDKYVNRVMAYFNEYIMKETLSVVMVAGAHEGTITRVKMADFVEDAECVSKELLARLAAESQEFKISGHSVKLAVTRFPR
jgi:isoleucyl-tRNA synthetase